MKKPRRKTAKRPRATKRAKPRKTAKRTRKTSAKKTPATRGRRKTARRTRSRAAAVMPRRRAAARATLVRAAVPAAGGRERLAALVAAELQRSGYDAPDTVVVDAIAAVAAGYRMGPAADPPIRLPVDADVLVAPELAQRWVTGDRATLLDLRVHRPTVRATVDFNLEQLGLDDAGETTRAALTSLTLGSWDPAVDPVAKRNAIAGFMVRWYRDGLGAPA